jgi:hypothetical protein
MEQQDKFFNEEMKKKLVFMGWYLLFSVTAGITFISMLLWAIKHFEIFPYNKFLSFFDPYVLPCFWFFGATSIFAYYKTKNSKYVNNKELEETRAGAFK